MLETVDLDKRLKKSRYKKLLPDLQLYLHRLQGACREANVGTIVVFEGWEACGKGAAIGRLTRRLEPRAYHLHSVRAPRTHELPMPWLARFWVATPSWGKMGIFDRSWYRRVLIERVEGATGAPECERSYGAIRSFERMLTDDRYEIVKLFMHISADEQERRLKQREEDAALDWMVTPRHWERHAQYVEYATATELMLEHTEAEWAPWTIVESTDRHWARVKVLEAVAAAMRAGLERRGFETPERPERDDA